MSASPSNRNSNKTFAVLLATLWVVIAVACSDSETDTASDLRTLPRFGELVRKVDRSLGEETDDRDADTTEAAAESLAATTTDETTPPPPPVVDRSSFPTEPTAEADAQARARIKPIVQLQRFRRADVARVGGDARPTAEVVVTDLSPRVGIAHLAEIRTLPGAGPGTAVRAGGPWHLHNADPSGQLLRAAPDGLLLVTERGDDLCRLWPGGDPSILEAAVRQGRELETAWIPLCGRPARVFLRLPVSGRKTRKEWTTDFLRDNLPAGEQLTVMVRSTIFADSELRVGVLEGRSERARRLPGAPPRVAIDPRWSDLTTAVGDLGLPAAGVTDGKLPVGRWLPLEDRRSGVWVSLFQPRLVDAAQVADPRLQPLDEVEQSSMVYLVAFDLQDHEVAFALGTEHPRIGWSERVPEGAADRSRPGPDGFADAAPIVRTGQVPPHLLADLQATFTGGFKRSHGAFKWGRLSQVQDGSHYGFVEDGVVWSRPVPGLATVTIWDDGRLDLHTWQESDDASLARVRHLRQNGVPLLAPQMADDGSETVRVGELVGRWGEGNWSGSQDQKLRSVRAGLCLVESPKPGSDAEGSERSESGDRHLVYGWFSAATPSGMAKVFLAYGCRYALLLDMNALEHTYLSILTPPPDAQRPLPAAQLKIAHLVRGMEVLDETRGGVTLPRFAGFPDNRDFFYLTRKSESTGDSP